MYCKIIHRIHCVVKLHHVQTIHCFINCTTYIKNRYKNIKIKKNFAIIINKKSITYSYCMLIAYKLVTRIGSGAEQIGEAQNTDFFCNLITKTTL